MARRPLQRGCAMNLTISIRPAVTLAVAPLALLVAVPVSPLAPLASSKCDTDNGGLVLPEGFCATLVASQLGPVRQMVVRPNGDLYAALSGKPGDNTGDVLAFRDRDGDGKPDERASFGPGGGNDVKLHGEYLYFALNDRVVRYRFRDGELKPEGKEEVVVTGLPNDGGHQAKSLAFGAGGAMYVNIGSKTNSCQKTDRLPGSPGHDPCTELQRRGGIWRFSADRLNQRFADGVRYATGLRNAMALAIQPGTGTLWAAINGRDQLADNWGFSNEVNANNPAEELVPVEQNGDYGWPYCYYSNQYQKKVLAPEYGGDGQKIGRCGAAKNPIVAFPGHWAPMALAFYTSNVFGPEYHGGLFLAFRGSWNRDPLPQEGYRVVFLPFADGRPSGEYSTFATEKTSPTSLRATGVAVGPDGSLYISADQNGKIWKVTREQ
jgi:glucose/arabinose dehydrogenase